MAEESGFRFEERGLTRIRSFEVWKGNDLLGWCEFSRKGRNEALIYTAYTNSRSRSSVEFKHAFGVTPVQYLLERLVRRGVRSFSAGLLGKPTEGMIGNFINRELVTRNLDNPELLSVTPRMVALAESRTVFVPGDKPKVKLSRRAMPVLKERLKRAYKFLAKRR